MKKLILLFMSLLLIFSLAACSSEISSKNSENKNSNQNANATVNGGTNNTSSNNGNLQPTNSSTSANTINNGGKTLVVYYSATGSTEKVAKYIAEAMNGDIFKLEPVNPYSAEDLRWTDKNSRVVHEHDNPSARAVELVKKIFLIGRVMIKFLLVHEL